MDNVRFGHKNQSRVGFCINHYPDFIVQLDSGIIVLLEMKGDDRDNSDSRAEIELGSTWTHKASEQYRYFMGFDKATDRWSSYYQGTFAKTESNMIGARTNSNFLTRVYIYGLAFK